ncbi:MAG: NAD(P)/FAD-dependent oxidoreductase [Deltaproteobacteria bacterium]|nr:NAD(P)/FAD-dependent oxidoreductase [Deltaproteobacteria bacterium]
MSSTSAAPRDAGARFDVIVVGAGFAGMYLLYRLRQMGLTARVYEAGTSVGGTWYWNRYPGARCDAESLAYSYSFSRELEQEWEWTERYATQPEILKYAEHVAERFDLKRDMRFETRVTRASFDDARAEWSVETDRGDRAIAKFCVMATGCLSVPQEPNIPGLRDFSREMHWASRWPHHEVRYENKRVGVIGTGSSAIQAIPVIAETAGHLTVFQRTPNFSVPAVNAPLDPEFARAFKRNYPQHRQNYRLGLSGGFGDLTIEPQPTVPAFETSVGKSEAELRAALERSWRSGGARFCGTILDTLANEDTNRFVASYVHEKIRSIVRDPATAEALCPTSHPIGTKRICVDIGYFETYNRPNVKLVDIAKHPIERITATGIQIQGGEFHELDMLVMATGFDAMTGALARIDIRGAGGAKLSDAWAAGPKTYLGIGSVGFPNLFMITGPGSPSVLSNMLVSIEQHVDWTLACIDWMRQRGFARIEAKPEAQEQWVAHVNEVANGTLMPRAASWYMGANIPGKPRVFMPYAAGVGVYREICDRVAKNGYEGFAFGG